MLQTEVSCQRGQHLFARVYALLPLQREEPALRKGSAALRAVDEGDTGLEVGERRFRIGAGLNDGEQKLLFLIRPVEEALDGGRLLGKQNRHAIG